MKREELLQTLKQALNTEEKAIPIYSKHLETAVLWTGIPKDKISKIKQILEQLLEDTKRHKETVTKMIQYVNEGGKDAY